MKFNEHSNLQGAHAFLSASKYSWVNYDEERLVDSYSKYQATLRGTVLHDFARRCIELHQKLPRSNKTLNLYVNDAVGFNMTPEQTLYYSDNCFGTADAISFRKNELRIHDLKTGVTPAHFEQLEIYAALFCLEYHKNPEDIDIVLCIYQDSQIREEKPEAERIRYIMTKIQDFDMVIDKLAMMEA